MNVFSKAFLSMKKGVGRLYSQSRGRGCRYFSGGFAPRPPQTFSLPSPPQSKICSAVPVSTNSAVSLTVVTSETEEERTVKIGKQ